jgi:hypothetical protein
MCHQSTSTVYFPSRALHKKRRILDDNFHLVVDRYTSKLFLIDLMCALQDGYTVHKTFASYLGVWTGIRDEALHRAVHSVPAATHILRLSAAVRSMLDNSRILAQREQSILTI